MNIPTEAEKLEVDAKHDAALVSKQIGSFDTLFIDFLPQIAAVAFVVLVIGLVSGYLFGRGPHL